MECKSRVWENNEAQRQILIRENIWKTGVELGKSSYKLSVKLLAAVFHKIVFS